MRARYWHILLCSYYLLSPLVEQKEFRTKVLVVRVELIHALYQSTSRGIYLPLYPGTRVPVRPYLANFLVLGTVPLRGVSATAV